MKKIRIGILGTASIAFNRFLPALMQVDSFEYVGVASRDIAKTEKFIEKFGGKGYESYGALINDDSIDALYIPLPPSLHYEWAKKAMEAGKHILCEKPFTTNSADTHALLAVALERNLAIHENYMFLYHKQLAKIKEIIASGELGTVRHIRIAFTFPNRGESDFRYHKELGGGALLDCGGYTLALAEQLLPNCVVVYAHMENLGREVESIGHVVVRKDEIEADLLFGMDQCYRCELEVLCEKGSIRAPRIFTAPDNYEVILEVESGYEKKQVAVGYDNHFANSIMKFEGLIHNKNTRIARNKEIERQAELVNEVMEMARK